MTMGRHAAGTAGLVTAALFVVLLLASFGYDPQAFSDPEAALRMAQERAILKAFAGIVTVGAAAAAALFFTGLGAVVTAGSPALGSAIRVFGAIGAAGMALGTLNDWIGVSYLAGAAAKDQVAAQHGWVALQAANAGAYSLAGFFLCAAVLATAWAAVSARTLTRTVGWIGVGAAATVIVAVLAQIGGASSSPLLGAIYLIAGGLLLLWFGWVGVELRRV